MDAQITFGGRSGGEYRFNRVGADAPWARNAGIAMFAVAETYGWRVIGMTEITGRSHDVRPLWALREAERYGAPAVFFSSERDPAARKAALSDLQGALSPLVGGAVRTELKLAA